MKITARLIFLIILITSIAFTATLLAVPQDDEETALKKQVSSNPKNYIAMTKLGDIYLDRGGRKEAFKLFSKAIKIEPDYPIAHFFIGRLYFLTRDYDKAILELNLFKEGMRLLPEMAGQTKETYIDGLYYLSEVYFTLRKYEDARRELEEILLLDPTQQYAYHDLGVYYYVYEHNRSRAYQSFMKAVELDPTTHVGKMSKYAIEFMRNNPDSRIVPDFSFIDREYRD